MNVVGPGNCWDAYASGIPGGKDFKNLFSILDFPMESLEESEFLEDDWDISKSQCLGPIPSDVLMDPLMETESPSLSTGPAVFIGGAPELHKVPECIQGSSGSGNLQHSSSHLEIPKLKIFQSQRHNSVLESNGSCSNRGTSLKTGATIPVKARSKRVRAVVNPWLALSPFLTSNPKREKAQRKKAVISHQQFAKENKNEKVKNSLPVTSDKDEASVGAKKCAHCEVTKTPQWREGPTGPKTLCNACGVRYRSGRLFPEYRPAASPTFTPALHSNSHKKVIEMRNKANKIDEPPMSPLPEFVPKSSFLFEYF